MRRGNNNGRPTNRGRPPTDHRLSERLAAIQAPPHAWCAGTPCLAATIRLKGKGARPRPARRGEATRQRREGEGRVKKHPKRMGGDGRPEGTMKSPSQVCACAECNLIALMRIGVPCRLIALLEGRLVDLDRIRSRSQLANTYEAFGDDTHASFIHSQPGAWPDPSNGRARM